MAMQTAMNFGMNMSSSCTKGAFCSLSSIFNLSGISLSVVAISAISIIRRIIIGGIIRIRNLNIIPG